VLISKTCLFAEVSFPSEVTTSDSTVISASETNAAQLSTHRQNASDTRPANNKHFQDWVEGSANPLRVLLRLQILHFGPPLGMILYQTFLQHTPPTHSLHQWFAASGGPQLMRRATCYRQGAQPDRYKFGALMVPLQFASCAIDGPGVPNRRDSQGRCKLDNVFWAISLTMSSFRFPVSFMTLNSEYGCMAFVSNQYQNINKKINLRTSHSDKSQTNC